MPVSLIEQLGLVALQLTLGRAHQIRGPALPQPLEVLLAADPAVEDPNALRLAVFPLHHLHDVFQRRDIVAVTGEYFVGDREPFRGDDEPDADLLAVGPAVTRVAPGRQLVVLGQTFKVGAGHVVEQELEAHAKPIAVALLHMRAQRFLVAEQLIQPSIQSRLIDLLHRNA